MDPPRKRIAWGIFLCIGMAVILLSIYISPDPSRGSTSRLLDAEKLASSWAENLKYEVFAVRCRKSGAGLGGSSDCALRCRTGDSTLFIQLECGKTMLGTERKCWNPRVTVENPHVSISEDSP